MDCSSYISSLQERVFNLIKHLLTIKLNPSTSWAAAVKLRRRRSALLQAQLVVEPPDECLRLPIHTAAVVLLLLLLFPSRKRRVRYPQLPRRCSQALPEPPCRHRRREAQNLQLLHQCGRHVDVKGQIFLFASAISLEALGGGEEESRGGCVAAAELHVVGGVEEEV